MRRVRDVLRLTHEHHLSHRQVAQSVGISRTAVGEYLRRSAAAGVRWPDDDALDDTTLEQRLFPAPAAAPDGGRPEPDWEVVQRELRRKGVTLSLLWQEYKAVHPDGYRYSWFCEAWQRHSDKLDVVMRQVHRPGEKLFVDYAGQTVDIVDRQTGEVRAAQIFVAVLGASSYSYAEATFTQTLPDFIGAHVRALAFFGGAPSILVPDNLKSAVTRAHRYEPDLNATYQEFARHYGIAVVPARAARPRDKAKVEAGVLLVERWILAALRHRQFFTLADLNAAIRELLATLNARPFRKLAGSRASLFAALDRPALRPLPANDYEFAFWKKARVSIDYHVEVDGAWYSVPYQLLHTELDVRLTARALECLHRGARVASHLRLPRGHYSTQPEHMPASHRAYAEWTPERLVRWARGSGAATAAVVEGILARHVHPQQGFRSCLGIMRLGKRYGSDRLEAACQRALAIDALRYRSIESILRRGLDRQPVATPTASAPAVEHDNLRGATYYQ